MASWPNGWGFNDPAAIPPPGLYSMQRAGVPVTPHALDVETPILTTEGWKTMGTVKVGDHVYAVDGSPTRITHVSELFDTDCYRVSFADGASLVATGDHLWSVWDAHGSIVARENGNAWKTLSTEEIIDQSKRCVSGKQNRFRVRCDAVIATPEADLPIDPYILGYWLGDGNSHSPTIIVGDADVDHVRAEIEHAGYRIVSENFRKSEWGSGWDIRFANDAKHMDGIESRLKRLGILGNKRIPETYALASQKQRMALLAGLLDSDGCISKPQGRVVFCAASRAFAEQVHELARSLGERATLTEQGSMWHVKWTPTFDPFRMARKSVRFIDRTGLDVRGRRQDLMALTGIEPVPTVPTRCIAVEHDSHVFLAGRLLTPTHNTLLQVDVVHTAIRVISNAIIKMGDPRGYTTGYDDQNQPYKKWLRPQPKILTNTFGPMFQYDGRRRSVISMALFGEAFWYVTSRDYLGFPASLEVLHPVFIKVDDKLDEDGNPIYWYGTGVYKQQLDTANMIHIPFMALPGARRGLSSVEYAGITGALALASYEYGSRWFAQGASPSFLLSTEQKLGKEQVERIAQKFIVEHSGLQSSHLPLVLDSGMKAQKVSSTPDEAQFLGTLEYARSCIAAWFGLPSHLVGGTSDKGNVWGKTVEEQGFQLIDFTLSGYVVPLEEAYSSLLPRGQQASFNEKALRRDNAADRAALLLAERTAGTLTQNEDRVSEGRPPLPGGDDLSTPLNSNTSPTAAVGGAQAGDSEGNGSGM